MEIKKNENKFFTLLNFSGSYKIFTIIGCILSAISAIFLLIPFIYIWKFIEALFIVFPNFSQAQNLEYYAFMAILFAVLGIIINFIGLMCTHVSAFRNERNMKYKTMKHILTLPLGYFQKNTSGSLRKRIDYSTSTTEGFLAHQLPDLTGAIVTPIAFFIILFSFNWILALVSLIPIIISFILLMTMISGESQKFMVDYQKSLEKMNSEAVEYVRGIPVTKTFQQTIYSYKNFYKSIRDYRKFVSRYTFSWQLPMSSFTVSVNGFFAVLIPAGILLIGSIANTDFLLSFVFYVILTPFCSVMLNKVMMVSQEWFMAREALKEIENILDEKPLSEPVNPQSPQEYSIEFEEVYFDYDKSETNEKHTLNNINLKIKEGETVALVGPSGGGKTTIASLIPRFWDVDKGSITIGNVNIKDISQKELMEKISFVFQDTHLLKDSIYNNIAMSKENATRKEVLEALKLAQCEDILERLPAGINTIIGKEGTYFSGGEQQRIALARAILKDAPIIILDEATALADPENELKIQKAISEITKNKTVLMIAHRLSTIKNVDKIFVVNDGEIIEEGSHSQLIESNGVYADMWKEFNESVEWKVKNTSDEKNGDNND